MRCLSEESCKGGKMVMPMVRIGRAVLLLLVTTFSVQAQSTAIEASLTEPKLVGEARLKVMFWNVFDAALYSETGFYDKNASFALSLTYLRSLKGEQIVEKSMEEIRQLAIDDISAERLQSWEGQLSSIIPDVSTGVSITGVRTPDGSTHFYLDDEMVGLIEDREFTELFFSIWLDEKTSEPEFRAKLLGLDRAS